MDINSLVFFDVETRAFDDASENDGNVKTAGTYRYAKNSFVIILTYAIGDGPVRCVALDEGFDRHNRLIGFGTVGDPALDEHYKRARRGEAWFAAWNTGFDRQAWNNGTVLPALHPEMTIDIMAQAVASNLPPALEGASRFIGRAGKQDDGKALIKLFCSPNGGTPQSHPVEWERFKSYAVRDTNELREVFKATRPLPLSEWREYWASERINDRGMAVDVGFCRRAAAVADLDIARTNALLKRYTNGVVTTVNQSKRLAEWIWDSLAYDEARDLLVTTFNEEEDPETGEEITAVKLSMERSRVTTLIAFFHAMRKRDGALSARDETILRVLELREFGASAAPKKFQKMVDQHDDGALRGGYVWNGAAQTGRFSSKGVQVHNMTRSTLGELELDAIEMIGELEV